MPVPRDIIERRRVVVVLAAALFAAIFVARVTFGTLADAFSFLYLIPLVLVAASFGARGGLAAGAVAFALSSISGAIADAPTSALGYANRGIVYLFVGALIGHLAKTLRAVESESARHFELSQDMACVAGFDGYFKRVNPAFERVLGYSEEDLLGRPFLEFVHPEDRASTEEEAAAIATGAGTVQFRNRYFAKDGSVRWIEWTSQPVVEEETIYAVARDVTDRKALEDELERLSQRDPLTGLFNRRRFEEELRRQLAYTNRYGSGGALLLIDVDRFKQINDSLGHAAGDKALCQIAALLRDNLRGGDVIGRGADPVVARLGGDEFVVLLAEVDEAAAQAVAARLTATMRDATLTIDGHEVRLGVSVGIATFDEYGRPGEIELLAAADRAMYEAKAAAR
ncbi:MAG TPA: sensor domain-containing diguanylate cyclase [Solirubrobacterales bacterium]|nr:sensor domain-containing diguanylate cyclase [Solirubrobacterales bacterium]